MNKTILGAITVAAALAIAPAVLAQEDDVPLARTTTSLQAAADPFSGDRLYRDVVTYASLGEHRTATATDYLTHAWLAIRLKALGFDVELFPFQTRQFYPTETSVTIDKTTRLDAFPIWHPTPTRRGGIKAKVTTDLTASAGKLYLFDNPSGTVNQTVQATIQKAAAAGALGVIVVLTTTSQEIYGQNAQQLKSYEPSADPGDGDQTPWPIPVVTVGRKHRAALQTAIDGGLDVKVRSEGFTKESATSYVLTGSLARGPADKTLLVSTPVSGWFQNAGERGTGVAAWLALAEWASKQTSGVKWLFVASSGHELNFRGTHEFLKSNNIPAPEDVYLWTHLGANLINYDYVQNADGTQTKTTEPASQSIKYLSDNPSIVGALADIFVPSTNPEAEALHITGLQNAIGGGDLFYAKYFGYPNLLYFAGANAKFHTREDTPETTGPELLEPIAKLIRSAFEKILAGL